tara:strand:+ start:116 stop:370 length:255 start_codon:yes stop_codon:yes gene_type:complete
LLKLKSDKPYDDEFTVFIKVKIESLNEFSKFIPLILKKTNNISNDKIKINTVKKYLLISSNLKFIWENINLFINIFLGLLNDKI